MSRAPCRRCGDCRRATRSPSPSRCPLPAPRRPRDRRRTRTSGTPSTYLREEQTATLLARLDDGELDAALIALPYDTGDLGTEVIFEDEFLFACDRTHAFAGAGEVSFEALAGERLLLLEEGHCLRGHALDVCRIGDRKARAQFEASSLLTLVQMVAAGIGVTLVPRLALDAHITRGTGISLSRLAAPASRQIGLAWRRTSPRAGEFRLLADTLRELAEAG